MKAPKLKTITVRCTLDIPVEVPDTPEYEEYMVFDIEENHCPGTGLVGLAFDKLREKHTEQSTCWACAANGKNEIL